MDVPTNLTDSPLYLHEYQALDSRLADNPFVADRLNKTTLFEYQRHWLRQGFQTVGKKYPSLHRKHAISSVASLLTPPKTRSNRVLGHQSSIYTHRY